MAQKLLFEEPTVWSGLEGYLLAPELASALNVPGGGTVSVTVLRDGKAVLIAAGPRR